MVHQFSVAHVNYLFAAKLIIPIMLSLAHVPCVVVSYSFIQQHVGQQVEYMSNF
jgi:hypothetical protein